MRQNPQQALVPPRLGIVQGVELGIERGIVTEGIQGLPFLLAGQPHGGVLLERIEVDRQRGRLKAANKQVQPGQLLLPVVVIELQIEKGRQLPLLGDGFGRRQLLDRLNPCGLLRLNLIGKGQAGSRVEIVETFL